MLWKCGAGAECFASHGPMPVFWRKQVMKKACLVLSTPKHSPMLVMLQELNKQLRKGSDAGTGRRLWETMASEVKIHRPDQEHHWPTTPKHLQAGSLPDEVACHQRDHELSVMTEAYQGKARNKGKSVTYHKWHFQQSCTHKILIPVTAKPS